MTDYEHLADFNQQVFIKHLLCYSRALFTRVCA